MGLGLMLLTTLTRQHVLAVLIGAQVVSSVFTMLAKTASPDAMSPHTTFPDFSQGLYPGVCGIAQTVWSCCLTIGVFSITIHDQAGIHR